MSKSCSLSCTTCRTVGTGTQKDKKNEGTRQKSRLGPGSHRPARRPRRTLGATAASTLRSPQHQLSKLPGERLVVSWPLCCAAAVMSRPLAAALRRGSGEPVQTRRLRRGTSSCAGITDDGGLSLSGKQQLYTIKKKKIKKSSTFYNPLIIFLLTFSFIFSDMSN